MQKHLSLLILVLLTGSLALAQPKLQDSTVADIRTQVPFKLGKAQSWSVHRVMEPRETLNELTQIHQVK